MDTNAQINIVDLKNALFDTAQYLGKDVLKESIKVLHSFLNCAECSLWSINHNNTHKEKENNEFISTSLICREVSVSYSFQNKTDFVHDLRNCLFSKVINVDNTSNLFFRFSKEKAIEYGHRSKSFVEEIGLNDFVVFPIFNKNTSSVIALVEISYIKPILDNPSWRQISSVIIPFFSAAFTRDSFIQKQSIMESLIECHRKHRDKETPVLFNNIIHNVLLKACPAEGASIFVWDTYQNRYNL